MVARRKKSEVPKESKGATRKVRARRTRYLDGRRPIARPECEVIPIYFEVDAEVVAVIDGEGNRISLFPSHWIGGFPARRSRLGGGPSSSTSKKLAGVAESLRSAIITMMADLETEDNGIV